VDSPRTVLIPMAITWMGFRFQGLSNTVSVEGTNAQHMYYTQSAYDNYKNDEAIMFVDHD